MLKVCSFIIITYALFPVTRNVKNVLFQQWNPEAYKCTPCLRKNSQNCFCHNFVKFLLTFRIFDKLMAKMTKLCKVHSFSTSLNLCQCTTV